MGCGDTVRDIRTAIGDPPRCPHYEVGGHPWGHGDGVRDPTAPPAWGGGVYGDMGTRDGVRDPTVPPAWGGGRLWGHGGTGDTGLGTPLRPLRGEGASMGTWDGVRDPTAPPAWGGGVYGDMDGVKEPTVPPAWGGDIYGDMGAWGTRG